jgi:excisionase family DNA binding protein
MADTAMYSTKRTASKFHVSVRTLLRWVAEGRIATIQPGGPGTKRMFPADQVEAALQPGTRMRHEALLDAPGRVLRDVEACFAVLQGVREPGRIVAALTKARDRIDGAISYHQRLAADTPPVKQNVVGWDVATEDPPGVDPAEMEAALRAGEELWARELADEGEDDE